MTSIRSDFHLSADRDTYQKEALFENLKSTRLNIKIVDNNVVALVLKEDGLYVGEVRPMI